MVVVVVVLVGEAVVATVASSCAALWWCFATAAVNKARRAAGFRSAFLAMPMFGPSHELEACFMRANNRNKRGLTLIAASMLYYNSCRITQSGRECDP